MNNFLQDKPLESTAVSKTLRLSVWDMFAGPNKTKIKCFMCGRHELNKTQAKQWDASHIVARHYHRRKPCRFDLIPACPACNNECSDMTIFDFLWVRERYTQLGKIIRSIYKAFREESPERFEDEFNSEAWLVLQHFYAGKHFLSGGGIVNQRQIFNFVKTIQSQDEYESLRKYTQKIKRSNDIIEKCCKRVKLEVNHSF